MHLAIRGDIPSDYMKRQKTSPSVDSNPLSSGVSHETYVERSEDWNLTDLQVLLGSGGIGTNERKETYRSLVNSHFSGCQCVVFVPFASYDHAEYTSRMEEFIGEGGTRLVGIGSFGDNREALQQADGIYVGGGNSFLLVSELHKQGIMDLVRKRVLEGMPYLGVSAGANVACPSMMTTNDMPITMVPSFETLGLVPFQINPHYYPGGLWFRESEEGDLSKHYGESRARRISEFHEMSDYPVIGMYEGSYLRSEGDFFQLIGNKAVLIRKGSDLTTVEPGAILTRELTTT